MSFFFHLFPMLWMNTCQYYFTGKSDQARSSMVTGHMKVLSLLDSDVRWSTWNFESQVWGLLRLETVSLGAETWRNLAIQTEFGFENSRNLKTLALLHNVSVESQ
ncbi:hypothetical protein Mp_6g02160 [Marchantia polymorpha subsp. ruderalis]|uniref:Uncharacterized protein n=1 Tax=Marchantia polymorpha subsp. ruderalis TaxID=1480154 RepID=A0AAF6BMN1_MARPO|nr:hypothetical protein Mp_6g02160 [Marchantia polymorpha subsp. ruderalis]